MHRSEYSSNPVVVSIAAGNVIVGPIRQYPPAVVLLHALVFGLIPAGRHTKFVFELIAGFVDKSNVPVHCNVPGFVWQFGPLVNTQQMQIELQIVAVPIVSLGLQGGGFGLVELHLLANMSIRPWDSVQPRTNEVLQAAEHGEGSFVHKKARDFRHNVKLILNAQHVHAKLKQPVPECIVPHSRRCEREGCDGNAHVVVKP